MSKDFPSCAVRYSLWRGSACVLLGVHLAVIAWALLPEFWRAVWQAAQPEAQILAFFKLLGALAALAGGVYWLCAGVAAWFYRWTVVAIDRHGIRVRQPAVSQGLQRKWQLSWQDVVMVTSPSSHCFAFHNRYGAPELLKSRLLVESSDAVLPVIRQYVSASCLNLPPNAVPTTTFSYSLIRGCFYLVHGLIFGLFAAAGFNGLHKLLQNVYQHDAKLGEWLMAICAILFFGGWAVYLLWCWLATLLFCRRPVVVLDGKGITVSNPAALFQRKCQIAWRDVKGISFSGFSFYSSTRKSGIAHLTIRYAAGRLGHEQTWKIGVHALRGGAHAVYHSALLYHAAHTKPAQSWRERLEQQLQELSSLEQQLQGEIETLLKKQKNS